MTLLASRSNYEFLKKNGFIDEKGKFTKKSEKEAKKHYNKEARGVLKSNSEYRVSL